MTCAFCGNALIHIFWYEEELRLCTDCYATVFENFLQTLGRDPSNGTMTKSSSKDAEQGSVRSLTSDEWDDSSAARFCPSESDDDSDNLSLSYRYPLYTIYEVENDVQRLPLM